MEGVVSELDVHLETTTMSSGSSFGLASGSSRPIMKSDVLSRILSDMCRPGTWFGGDYGWFVRVRVCDQPEAPVFVL